MQLEDLFEFLLRRQVVQGADQGGGGEDVDASGDDQPRKEKEAAKSVTSESVCVAEFVGNFNAIFRDFVCGGLGLAGGGTTTAPPSTATSNPDGGRTKIAVRKSTLLPGTSAAQRLLLSTTPPNNPHPAPQQQKSLLLLDTARRQLFEFLTKECEAQDMPVTLGAVSRVMLSLFELGDEDGDGLLSYPEFQKVLKNAKAAKIPGDVVDVSRRKKISFLEFLFALAPSTAKIREYQEGFSSKKKREVAVGAGAAPNAKKSSDVQAVFSTWGVPPSIDEMAVLLYNCRRSLRKALQHFDPNSSYFVTREHLRYAIQGLVAALPSAGFSEHDIKRFVDLVPSPGKEENNLGKEDNPGKEESNLIDYNTLLDSFVIVGRL